MYVRRVHREAIRKRVEKRVMSDAWKKYRGAPAEGTVLCPAHDVPQLGTRCLVLHSAGSSFPVVIVRAGDVLRAYVNACPHQYLPLNYRGDRVLSADRKVLRCTNHDAAFRVDNGEGVEGLGNGLMLDPIPLIERDGMICMGGELAAPQSRAGV